MSNCLCDRLVHPARLAITAGQTRLPRQIGGFLEFRRAMLAGISQHTALDGWRAPEGDLGLMWLELWAYACDVVAFADETIAHECYVRTARQRPSVRRLVALLGYLPRPAVAATVDLAVMAEGRRPLHLPKGIGFRSSAFGDEAPQVFETDASHTVHPFRNRWTIRPPRGSTIGAAPRDVSRPRLLLKQGTANVGEADPFLIRTDTDGFCEVHVAKKVASIEGFDGGRYTEVTLDLPVELPDNTELENIELTRPTEKAALWTQQLKAVDELAVETIRQLIKPHDLVGLFSRLLMTTAIYLDALHPDIRSGDRVIVSKGGQYRPFTVAKVSRASRTVEMAPEEGLPAIKVPVTRLLLDAHLNSRGSETWDDADRDELTVHYGFVSAGVVTREADSTLAPTDRLTLEPPVEAEYSEPPPVRFQLEDKNEFGVAVGGQVDYDDATLMIDPGSEWAPPLVLPVKAYGNIVSASRGEKVANEVLGGGDASVPNQEFALKKKPLTYVRDPSANNVHGIVTTLSVRVDGVLWREIPSFIEASPDAEVYIVRQNDDGASIVMFGDGKHGARLPTGTDNVVASYRYGAGAAIPPAGSITQISSPVTGLAAVRNPVSAYGGDDSEPESSIRAAAPRSALMLGRAISMDDFSAVASTYPGVRAVRTEWAWGEEQVAPVAKLWYVGDSSLASDIRSTLRNCTDPATLIEVEPAKANTVTLRICVRVDVKYVGSFVEESVRDSLLDPQRGILSPERVGIGEPLYRSRVLGAVETVAGVSSVAGLQFRGSPFSRIAEHPGPGRYFDFEAGLEVSGVGSND